MNEIFRDYTTSTAFALQLSKVQCHALLVEEHLRRGGVKYARGYSNLATLQALEARGLVFWKRDAGGRAQAFAGLTREGRIVVMMLKAAGLTVDNTRTVSTMRAVA